MNATFLGVSVAAVKQRSAFEALPDDRHCEIFHIAAKQSVFYPLFAPVDDTRRRFSAGTNVAPQRRMSNGAPVIYWHRQLPPLEAEVLGDHVLEATSNRVRDSLACRDALWDSCYRNLMNNVEARLRQEVRRLGGDYAHVTSESIDSRHDDSTGEAWLHGRIDYVLYRRPC